MIEGTNRETSFLKNIENLSKDTIEYITHFLKEEKINNSFKVINPSDIVFDNTQHYEYENGCEEDMDEYVYNTVIGGLKYKFYVFVIDGNSVEYDEDEGSEFKEEYHAGRIDFSVGDTEFITNIGLKEINNSDEIIKDLFRFIYLKNKANYLVVEASKISFKSSSSENEVILQIKRKVEQIKKSLSSDFVINKFLFLENSEKIESVSSSHGQVELVYTDGNTRKFTHNDFLDFLCSEKVLNNSVLRHDVVKLISVFDPEGLKKQKQRFILYERKLSSFGFDIQKEGDDRLYAYVTDDLLNSLYGFASLETDSINLINRYILETNNKNPTSDDLYRWLNPRVSSGGRGNRRLRVR